MVAYIGAYTSQEQDPAARCKSDDAPLTERSVGSPRVQNLA